MTEFRRARLLLRDDGASAVEFALLFPLFIMLAIGTVSAGFAFHSWLSVTHGAQESSRFAATLSVKAAGGSADLWLAQVTDRALSASGLAIDATHARAGAAVCVSVVAPTNFPVLSRHALLTTDADGLIERAYSDGPCPGMSTMAGDYVQVSVSEPNSFDYIVAAPSIQISGSSINRYEAVTYS